MERRAAQKDARRARRRRHSAAGCAGVKHGRLRNRPAAAEGDNHEQADVLSKLARMSMSDLKKLCNTMNVDPSLSQNKTTLVDTLCNNVKQCHGFKFGEGWGPTMALWKRRRQLVST